MLPSLVNYLKETVLKKYLLALAALFCLAPAFATGCQSCTPSTPSAGSVSLSGSASGSNSILSGSSATATTGGAGSSFSYGANNTKASAVVGLTGSKTTTVAPNCDALLSGNISLNGGVKTSSESLGYNISSGTGTGSAAASGLANAKVSGSGSFTGSNPQGTVFGNVAGSASSTTSNSVVAGQNTGGYVFGATNASFASIANASLATQSPTTAGTCGGKACGPATADQKTAGTSVLAGAEGAKDSVNGSGFVTFMGTNLPSGTVLGNAVLTNSTSGTATGTANSGATGGVSTGVTSTK